MKTTRIYLQLAGSLALLLPSLTVLAGPRYGISDLGTLGGTYSIATSVNDSGQATGFSHSLDNVAQHAFLAQAGTPLLDLGTLGGSFSQGFAINGTGQVTGLAYLTGDASFHAVLGQAGLPWKDLGTLGGANSRGNSLNSTGEVTGWSAVTGDLAQHAFFWKTGLPMQDLGTLGGTSSQGNAINDAGQVVGYANLTGDVEQHAFLWQSGQALRDLGTLGGSHSEAYGINAAGDVAGYSMTAGNAQQHAFFWKTGQPMLDLGTLGGSFSEAYGLNAKAQVVGYATTTGDQEQRGFIWQNGALQDLNALVLPTTGWNLLEAHAISDAGYITGVGKINGQRHAFLLIPDTTPPTITCPAAVNVTTAGTQPASIGTATATDNLDPTPAISNDAPATFPAGPTTVIWTATDAAGNKASCAQIVSLAGKDATPPVVNPLWTPAAPDGSNGWYISPAPSLLWSVTDPESQNTVVKTSCVDSIVSVDTPSQSFACTATSAGGTTGPVTTTIKHDATAPQVKVPEAISQAATGAAGAIVNYALATATDVTSGVGSVSCSPVSGATFPLGSTTVDCTASDIAGNSSKNSFLVSVSDTVAPIVTVPANITVSATSTLGAPVTYTGASATDTGSGINAGGVRCVPASGSTFPLGPTTVTCSATDNAGNTGSAGFTVAVNDTVAPVLTVTANITAAASGPAGAIVTYPPATATDAISGAVGASCLPASGTTFKLGTTPVNCSATDAAGNTGTASFNVTVTDTVAPVVSVPANITASATSSAGAAVTYGPASATDNASGVSLAGVSCTPASGATFPLGVNTVSCSARDNAGNIGSASFTVTVNDTTPPILSLQSNITVSATSAAGAVVTYPPVTATDGITAVSAAGVSCTPASGSAFPLGTTAVNCSATDTAGNSGTSQFTVTVVDTTAPVLTAPGNVTASATSPLGAVVNYPAVTAADSISGLSAAGVSCAPASGATFALGITPVNCSAKDNAGNTGNASFTVTVNDTTPPVLTVPANISATATSAAGAVVTYPAVTAADAITKLAPAGVSCSPASGSTFALGATTVSCSAADVAGNTGTASFTVTVSDALAPVLSVPANITAAASSRAGAVVNYAAVTATDANSGVSAAGVSCAPATGSTFGLGATTVNCSAKDNAGNIGTGSFTVTVNDTTPPVLITPADITVPASGPAGAVVTYAAVTATDSITSVSAAGVSCTPASGATFPLGVTTVSCSAKDTAGNTGSASFTVTVTDTVAPVVSVPANITTPATGSVGAVVVYAAATATDNASGVSAAGVSCVPASASTFGLGTTTVACSAKDNAGNTGSASFTVTVTDTLPPTVTVPADLTAAATSAAGAVVSYTGVSATDNASGVTATGVSCAPVSGSTFALGVTKVNCSAQDKSGNTGSASFNVTVRDTTPPDISVPATVTLTATSPAGAVVSYPPASATDAISAVSAAGVVCLPASGTRFPIGTSTVNCSASDTAGNTANASFLVVVNPLAPPVDTTPPNIAAVVNPPAPDGANGWYVNAPVVVTWSITDAQSAVTNPVGCANSIFSADMPPQNLTCSATSAGGTAPTVSQTIKLDITAPVVTVPASVTASATSSAGALVSYGVATASDATSGVSAAGVSCLPASGGQFPLGLTTVRCSAQDNAGNTGTGSFTVTVNDTTPPVVSVPADITLPASGINGAVVSYVPASAVDAISGLAGGVSCSPVSGSTFALGTTSVLCSAQDRAGNTGTASFKVTVSDRLAPVVSVPANVTADATSSAGAVVTYASATATDAGSGVSAAGVSCAPTSGSTFALGATTVLCSAQDKAGNTGTASFNVTVSDTTAPQLSLPGNQTAVATSSAGAVVNFAASASASDAVSGSVPVNCLPASGSTFALGITPVSCSAVDAAANIGKAGFNVTVSDTIAPVVSVPADQTVEATGSTGAVVSFAASASDTVSGPLAVTCLPASGSTLALGITPVACTASDAAGNVGKAGFTVTVSDRTPPQLTLPANQTVTATSTAGAVVNFTASASDLVTGTVPVACSPAPGSTFAIGTTTVACAAADTAGNQVSQSFSVIVTPSVAGGVGVPVPVNVTVSSAAPGTIVDAVTPLIVDVTSPNAGPVTMVPTVLGTVEPGYSALGFGYAISAPPADAAQPLIIGFRIDSATLLPANVPVDSVTVFRDGIAVSPCTDLTSPVASPDPCVAGQALVNNVLEIQIRTAHASVWTFGARDVTAPGVNPVLTPATADGLNGWYRGSVGLVWEVSEPESPTTLSKTGCTPLDLTLDSGPLSATCTARSLGGTTGPINVALKRDATSPTVNVPAQALTVRAPAGASSASVTYPGVTATDATSGIDPATLACGSSQGTAGLGGGSFPIGLTTVNCSARDFAGNAGSASFTVRVDPPIDTTRPVITPTISGTTGANGWYTGPVTLSWTVSDADSTITAQTAGCNTTILSAETAGQSVTCSATSAGGTSAQSVTVKIDRTAPRLACPANLSVTQTQAIALGRATVSDNLTPLPQLVNNAPAGFPIGDTEVTWTATDEAGWTASCSQWVTVTAVSANTVPVAVDDLILFVPGEQRTVPAAGVLSNDRDAHDAVLEAVPASKTGSVSLNGDGSFSFNPVAGVNSTRFSYRARNDSLVSVNAATVSLRADLPPRGRADKCLLSTKLQRITGSGCSLLPGGEIRIDLLANDSDPDSASPVSADRRGTQVVGQTVVIAPKSIKGGSIRRNEDGSVDIAPSKAVVSFRYTVADDLGRRSAPRTAMVVVR